jgi:hypothetical protein
MRCVYHKYCTLYSICKYSTYSSRVWFTQRLFIDRPPALSAICLSWLGRLWNLGEGGLLCTEHASQNSIFCTAFDRSTASTVLAACSVHKLHNGPPSLKYQYSLGISSLGLSSLWFHWRQPCDCVHRIISVGQQIWESKSPHVSDT